jgi:hypothetical protein
MFVGAFEFEDGGRSYQCSVEGERTRAGAWWWFRVSGDAQRYAPFHPEPGDTKNSVRARIVSYYNALLVRRAMPPQPRHGAGRPAHVVAAVSTATQIVPETTPALPDEPTPDSDGNGDLGGV